MIYLKHTTDAQVAYIPRDAVAGNALRLTLRSTVDLDQVYDALVLDIARHFAKWSAKKFANIIRANLTQIDKNVQSQFEHLYVEITKSKMYGGYND